MGNILVGAKISYLRSSEQGLPMLSFLDQLELALKFDFLEYLLDSPSAPNADRDHAIILQTALILAF